MQGKILIVDDEFDDLFSMKEILEGNGFEVKTAANGAQALDLIENEKFSFILLDILMPVLSGYGLMRLFRQRIDRKMPIVYVSIKPSQDVDMDDIDGFIQKPFTPESLFSGVTNAIKKFKPGDVAK